MKKLKSIKLMITQCTMSNLHSDCWYSDKIGKSYYFFDSIFKDDGDNMESIWKAKLPPDYYVHLKDTNYDSYIRKQKLKKINKNANKIQSGE